jgi:hypothetical protein
MWAVFRGIYPVIGPKGDDFTYELMSTDMTASRGCPITSHDVAKSERTYG